MILTGGNRRTGSTKNISWAGMESNPGLRGENKIYLNLYLKIHSVPRSKHYLCYEHQSVLYREIIAVCSQIHTKHVNTLCGQNVVLLNVKLAVHIVTTGL